MNASRSHLDPTGFPMVWIPSLGIYFHCLPVTKVQVELFLCDALDGHFGGSWYDAVSKLNPRVTARRIWKGNYWQAFLTGVLPSEAERFAAWLGEGYRLPTRQEWTRIYLEMMMGRENDSIGSEARDHLMERPRELLGRLQAAAQEASTCHGFSPGAETRMLMRFGILEWVALNGEEPARWGGIGEPNPSLLGNLLTPENGEIVLPHSAESERLRAMGFRLVFDPRRVSREMVGEVGRQSAGETTS